MNGKMIRDITYRTCAINGATSIGLMLALFDRLVADLRRAATALHENDIETRCRELNHALLIVGQLENWVDRQSGGESAEQLARFYSYVRAKMIEASIKKFPKLLEEQADAILHVRMSWQQLDVPGQLSSTEKQAEPRSSELARTFLDAESERIPLSLSV